MARLLNEFGINPLELGRRGKRAGTRGGPLGFLGGGGREGNYRDNPQKIRKGTSRGRGLRGEEGVKQAEFERTGNAGVSECEPLFVFEEGW